MRGNSDSMMLVPKKDSYGRDAGKMCCLGFAAIQLGGVEPGNIEGDYNPNAEMCEGTPMEPFCQYANCFDPGSIAMKVNDDSRITDEEREKKLTQLFESHDIEVEFV
jgi:hypothetical protein